MAHADIQKNSSPTATDLDESTAVHLQFVRTTITPICNAVPSWLLSLEEREPNSTPPICTAIRLPFVRQYF